MSNGTARTVRFTRPLESALRTAFACAVVAGITVYGPTFLRRQLIFPTLSYLTIILILIEDTTLGHALRGFFHALLATIQVVPFSIFIRWLLSPEEKGGAFPVWAAAAAAAAAAFLVVLPESIHVAAKRIALSLIALICTEAVVRTDKARRGFMNPLHVGASALLGAFACLLASLIPIPIPLAHFKVNKLCQVYAENASERMDLYLRAFDAAADCNAKRGLVLRAKLLAEIGTKLLQGVKVLQEGMPWERHWSRSLDVEKVLQSFELPLRAMEYSLHSSFPPDQHQQPSPTLDSLAFSRLLYKKISKIQCQTQTSVHQQLPCKPLESTLSGCFFFSCVDILLLSSTNQKNQRETQDQSSSIAEKLKSWFIRLITFQRLRPSIKYAIALGLSVLLSVIIEKENAVWASHTVAASFISGRPAIFKVTYARFLGSAFGSVYGVIVCILFNRIEFRLLALIPWVVCLTFSYHSKMCSTLAGASAVVAALFILGRNNYGDVNEFVIGRLTSVFIGLVCLLLAEIVMQPVRASTLAKRQLSSTLVSLRECLRETRERKRTMLVKHAKLVESLKSLVADAESEPDLWCLPFPTRCYEDVVGCLDIVESLLYVVMYNLEVVSVLEDDTIKVEIEEFNQQLNYELRVVQGALDSLLEKLSLIKYVATSEDCVEDDESSQPGNKLSGLIREGVLRFMEAEADSENENRKRLVRCFGAIGFCITSLGKEVDRIEYYMQEIISRDSNFVQERFSSQVTV